MLTIGLSGNRFCEGSSDFVSNVRKPRCDVSGEMRPDDVFEKGIVTQFKIKKNVNM